MNKLCMMVWLSSISLGVTAMPADIRELEEQAAANEATHVSSQESNSKIFKTVKRKKISRSLRRKNDNPIRTRIQSKSN